MASVCSVCRFERVNEVNADLIQGTLTLRELEQKWGLSDSSLQRHRAVCLVKAVAESRERRNRFTAASLLDTLERIEQEAWSIHEINKADRPDISIKALVQIGGVVDRATKLLEIAQARDAANGGQSVIEVLNAARKRIAAAKGKDRTPEEQQEIDREVEKRVAERLAQAMPVDRRLPAPLDDAQRPQQ